MNAALQGAKVPSAVIPLDPQFLFIVSSASMGEITISRHGRTRFWAVRDASGELICVCVYKRGAMEVARRLGVEISYCLRDASPLAENPVEAGLGRLRDLPDGPRQGY